MDRMDDGCSRIERGCSSFPLAGAAVLNSRGPFLQQMAPDHGHACRRRCQPEADEQALCREVVKQRQNPVVVDRRRIDATVLEEAVFAVRTGQGVTLDTFQHAVGHRVSTVEGDRQSGRGRDEDPIRWARWTTSGRAHQFQRNKAAPAAQKIIRGNPRRHPVPPVGRRVVAKMQRKSRVRHAHCRGGRLDDVEALDALGEEALRGF